MLPRTLIRRMTTITCALSPVLVTGAGSAAPGKPAPGLAAAARAPKGFKITLVDRAAAGRLDVLVDGKPFTSYLYRSALKKPVLYPIRSAGGAPITRGFPLDPRPGERVDHPHHVGLWFNYGDVDGVDFWNNSDAIPPGGPPMGTIVHRALSDLAAGAGRAGFSATSEWRRPDGSAALHETTAYTFTAGPGRRVIDRVATLAARGAAVPMPDNKEGLLGLRLARALEHPSDKPAVMTDAAGRPTRVPRTDGAAVTGLYTSSEGKTGGAVWGTRGRWVMLTGTVEGEAVTIAILDHPKNPGHPTHWHARGYGLFAANPLGQHALDKQAPPLAFTIPAGGAARFAYRVLILSRTATAAEIDAEHAAFAAGHAAQLLD